MNKKIWIAVIMAAMLAACLLAGCSGDTPEDSSVVSEASVIEAPASDAPPTDASGTVSDVPSDTSPDAVSGTASNAASDVPSAGSLSGSESPTVSGGVSEETSSATESKPNETSKPSETSKPGETSKPVETSKPGETSKPEESSKPNDPVEVSKPAEPSEPEEPSKPEEPSQPEEPSKPEESSQPDEPSQPSEPEYGTEEWCRAVEERVVYYINKYRVEEGKGELQYLQRASEYCRYRCTQPGINHDADNKIAAATATKYGLELDNPENAELVNALQFNDSEKEKYLGKGYYYIIEGGEAACDYWSRKIDSTAKKIAEKFKRSAPHWAYVGDAAYDHQINFYIGVGVGQNTCYLIVGNENLLAYEN